MTSIGTYGFINAKVRAMRSFLLTDAVYRTLAAAEGLQEVFSVLSQTHLRNVVEHATAQEPEKIEQALLREEIQRIQSIQKKSHKRVVRLVTLYLERYDGERLKVILRYWHRKTEKEVPIIRERIVYDFPIDAIVMAETLGEVITLLEGTPFQDVLARVAAEYRKSQTLFPLELAIDRSVFDRLWQATGDLGTKDKSIARRLLGIEIDLRNLDWIGRLKTYYDLSSADIGDRTLPHGYRIHAEDIRRIATEGNVLQALIKVASGSHFSGHLPTESESDLKDLEHLLYQILVIEARKAFSEFPFSIGSILGYFTLLRIETRNVRTLFQAKRYGLPSQRIESLLVM
jgi:V/A-type H+-transporting ATPase subunit C